MKICCFSTKYAAMGEKGKYYLGIRIMCPREATYIFGLN
jgi:hypothetical protein